MKTFYILIIIINVLMIVAFPFDLHFYSKAKYPERCKWYYKLLFGRFFAFFIEGKDKL